jgi:hypothetical protein
MDASCLPKPVVDAVHGRDEYRQPDIDVISARTTSSHGGRRCGRGSTTSRCTSVLTIVPIAFACAPPVENRGWSGRGLSARCCHSRRFFLSKDHSTVQGMLPISPIVVNVESAHACPFSTAVRRSGCGVTVFLSYLYSRATNGPG